MTTKDLDRDEWLVWITDDDAKKPKAGKPAPDWMKVQNLPSGGQYRYLIDNCYASICIVNDYMTWNLSVQDAIKANKPSLTFKHPTQEHVLGKDYPLYFTDKKSFLELLDNTPTDFKLITVEIRHGPNEDMVKILTDTFVVSNII